MNNEKESCKPKLLLVEPDDKIRDTFQIIFDRAGYRTIAVESEKYAWQVLNEGSIDMIILDYDLYDCNGLGFMDLIKSNSRNIVTVLLSNFGDLYNHSQNLFSSIDHVIEKPLVFEKLFKIMKNYQNRLLET